MILCNRFDSFIISVKDLITEINKQKTNPVNITNLVEDFQDKNIDTLLMKK